MLGVGGHADISNDAEFNEASGAAEKMSLKVRKFEVHFSRCSIHPLGCNHAVRVNNTREKYSL